MLAGRNGLPGRSSVRRLVLANTLHSPEMWQRNHENINRELELQFPEVWDAIMALRSQGVRSTDPRVQELYAVHAKLVRFYNPDNAAKLQSEPGARNPELYRAFVGDDVEFFVGGQVPAIPDFRPRLREIQAPLLILAGRYDRALYPAYQRDFQRAALEDWVQEYRGDLGIALSDVVGMDAFLADFDLYFAKLFDGLRHDSGDPIVWGEKALAHYARLRDELTERFGGLTAYTRAPAQGLWAAGDDPPMRDDIIVYEVMVDALDRAWWTAYRRTLEDRFAQDELVIRAQFVERL